jgi:hypothetical protein
VVDESKYIENVCVEMYEEPISFEKVLMESFKCLDVELPEINLEGMDKNALNLNFSNVTQKVPNPIKSNTSINQSMLIYNTSGIANSVVFT